ncbi:G5 domain-containing protein [Bacillus sp. JJ1533]|uniref:G5 domain-containing protein n=1 Tax=Bacillus sp. JJ1533 TaxID=3122959 RepID=UPI003000C021
MTETENEDSSKATVKQSTVNTPSSTVKGEKKTETKSPSTSTSSPAPKKDTVTTKTTTASESIPFLTVYQNDASLEKGKQVVVQNGVNGTKTITYKETYTNGALTSKDIISTNITKQPVDKIVKIGTKVVQAVPTYLSSSQAHSILSGSGVLSKHDNSYTMSDGFGTMFKVVVGSSYVSSIFFDGTTYYAWKATTKQGLVDSLGEDEGTKEYDAIQNEIRKIESGIRAAANAVYGSGTSNANSLYSQIINGGKSSSGFYKTF